MKLICTILVFTLPMIYSCLPKDHNTNYELVYKNDKSGHPIKGSKAELIQRIRGGADIKIAWGSKGKTHTIEHLSTPIWLAVLDETEVTAHLDAQVFSTTDWDNLTSHYSDSTSITQEWRVAITTKGEFDAVWIDRSNHKIVKRVPQQHTMSWFAKGGSSNNTPLFVNE